MTLRQTAQLPRHNIACWILSSCMVRCLKYQDMYTRKARARAREKIAEIRAQMRAHVQECNICSGRVVIYRKPRGRKLLLSIK